MKGSKKPGKTEAHLMAVRRAVISLVVYVPEMDYLQPYNENVPAARASGTAFVVEGLPAPTKEGFYACTAYHVVEQAVSIRAMLFQADQDESAQPIECRLVSYSIDLDAAVIFVKTPRPEWMVPLGAGDSDSLMPNDEVKAAGFPIREGFQVTTGFVSGRLPDRLQVDVAINPGNSGGCLLRVSTGTVVGIVVSTLVGAQNVNYVSAWEDVKRILLPMNAEIGRVKAEGKRVDGKGMGGKGRSDDAPLLSAPVTSFNFSLIKTAPEFVASHTGRACTSGALVTRVHERSSAYAAGLREDDVVCSIGEHLVSLSATVRVPWWRIDAIDYTTLTSRTPVGTKLRLQYYSRERRAMKTATITVEADLSIFRPIDVQSHAVAYSRRGGVVVQPLTEDLFSADEQFRKRFAYVMARPQLREMSLLVVTHVDPESPFTLMNQINPYDVVVAIGRERIDGGDLAQYESLFAKAMRKGGVILHTYVGAAASATTERIEAWEASHLSTPVAPPAR